MVPGAQAFQAQGELIVPDRGKDGTTLAVNDSAKFLSEMSTGL